MSNEFPRDGWGGWRGGVLDRGSAGERQNSDRAGVVVRGGSRPGYVYVVAYEESGGRGASEVKPRVKQLELGGAEQRAVKGPCRGGAPTPRPVRRIPNITECATCSHRARQADPARHAVASLCAWTDNFTAPPSPQEELQPSTHIPTTTPESKQQAGPHSPCMLFLSNIAAFWLTVRSGSCLLSS